MQATAHRRRIVAELHYEERTQSRQARRRRLLALCLVGVLGLLAVVMAEADLAAAGAGSRYQAARSQLDSDLQSALAAGYTEADLAPITSRLRESAPEPVWIGSRVGYYDGEAVRMDNLRGDLGLRLTQLVAESRTQLEANLAGVRSELTKGRLLDLETVGLDGELNALVRAAGGALAIVQLRDLGDRTRALNTRARTLVAAREAEYQAIQQTAVALKAQFGATPDVARKSGQDHLFDGRNDATVAAYLEIGPAMSRYRALEHFGALIESPDLDQTYLGVAGSQFYSDRIHEAMVAGLPSKVVMVSIWREELWAYEGGKQVVNSLITTGTPGDLPTPPGVFHVMSKFSPFKFTSAWPKSDPHYFDPLDSAYVAFFTSEGHAIHDASTWRTVYGPGTQYNGSHGCVNMPLAPARAVFHLLEIGTTIVIIPGDGTHVDQQLRLRRDGSPGLAGA
jgi:hypothetical protein